MILNGLNFVSFVFVKCMYPEKVTMFKVGEFSPLNIFIFPEWIHFANMKVMNKTYQDTTDT